MESSTPTSLPPHKRSKKNASFHEGDAADADPMCECDGGESPSSPLEDEEGRAAVDSLNLSAIAISMDKPVASTIEEFLANPTTFRPREDHLTQLIEVSYLLITT